MSLCTIFMVVATDKIGPGACVLVQVHVNITGVVMLSAIKQALWWGVNMSCVPGA